MLWTGSEDYYLAKALNTLDVGCNTFNINNIPVISDSSFSILSFTLNETSLSPVIQSLSLTTSVFPFTQLIHCNTAVGIFVNKEEFLVLAFPNPINRGELLEFHFNNSFTDNVQIIIHDIIGNIILSKTLYFNTNNASIETGMLSSSIYLVEIISSGRVISKFKLIVI